jgi:pimeloyl-ACP methyl ester carboxylesterase
MSEVTPLTKWPDTPRSLIIATDDRCIPRESALRTASRLFNETPIEIPGGHCPALSRPRLLAETLLEVSRAVS